MVQVPELHRGTTCAIRAFKAPGALRADRAPRGFQLHEEVPFPWSSKTGGPTPQALRPLGALGPSRPLRALLALTQHFLMYSCDRHLHVGMGHNSISSYGTECVCMDHNNRNNAQMRGLCI